MHLSDHHNCQNQWKSRTTEFMKRYASQTIHMIIVPTNERKRERKVINWDCRWGEIAGVGSHECLLMQSDSYCSQSFLSITEFFDTFWHLALALDDVVNHCKQLDSYLSFFFFFLSFVIIKLFLFANTMSVGESSVKVFFPQGEFPWLWCMSMFNIINSVFIVC